MGKGTLENPERFKDQDYSKLRKDHQKLNIVFSDPTFPDAESSIGPFTGVPRVEWKRPRDLCTSPCLFVDGIPAPDTLLEGKLSSPWFVSSCSILAGIGEILHKVVPQSSKQEWVHDDTDDNYVGIFHFKFWRYGKWVDVVIDDLLPTAGGAVLGTHTSRNNEFWVSLLEKAYAKLHGSYAALIGGHVADALVDFTGGISEVKEINPDDYSGDLDKYWNLFSLLTTEINNGSILCATINVTNEKKFGVRTDMGLYPGYAYGITALKKVSLNDLNFTTLFTGRERIPFVRLWDSHEPSASTSEGKGKRPRSNVYTTSKLTRLLSKNPQWAGLQEMDKCRLGLHCDDTSEFWMPLEDLVSQFSELIICHLFNTSIFTLSMTWYEAMVHGKWTSAMKDSKHSQAGGSINFPNTFFQNPQYMFDVKSDKQKVILQMLQWDPADNKAGLPSRLISFYVHKVENNRKYRLHKTWEHNSVVISNDPIRRRELYYFGTLDEGRYILIPTTDKPGDDGNFVVRAFSPTNVNLRTMKHDAPKTHCFWCCARGFPVCVTIIHIKNAENLRKMSRISSCNAFCKIKCERHAFSTAVVKNSVDPVWDTAFILYRAKTDKPITIRVYNRNSLFPKNFMGQIIVPAPINEHVTVLHSELMNKTGAEHTQGILNFTVFTSENLITI